MKVKVTAPGFYLSRRNPGEEIEIPYELFATEWMESLEPKDVKAAADAKTAAEAKAVADAKAAAKPPVHVDPPKVDLKPVEMAPSPPVVPPYHTPVGNPIP